MEANETKLCEHCKAEIPKKAKVCPFCRKKQGEFKKAEIVLSVLLILAVIWSASDEPNTPKTTVTANPENTESPTDSPTPTLAPAATNANAKPTVERYMNDFDYEKVSRYPDDYSGKKYEINGEVTQVITSGWSDTVAIRINVDGDYKKNLYVEYDKDILSGNILTDDEVTIYATFKGLYSYTTVLGSSLTVPKVEAQLIKIKTEEEVKNPSEEDIELIEEYYYSDYRYQYRFLVIKNNSDSTVEISTSSLAYGNNGNIVSAGSANIEALGAGCTSLLCETYDTEEKIGYYETEWSVSKDKYYKSVIQDLVVTQTKIDGGVIVQVKNNGESDASWVEAKILFLKNGTIVDYDWKYFNDSDYGIKSGKTISEQINTMEDYDEVKVYLHGRK